MSPQHGIIALVIGAGLTLACGDIAPEDAAGAVARARAPAPNKGARGRYAVAGGENGATPAAGRAAASADGRAQAVAQGAGRYAVAGRDGQGGQGVSQGAGRYAAAGVDGRGQTRGAGRFAVTAPKAEDPGQAPDEAPSEPPPVTAARAEDGKLLGFTAEHNKVRQGVGVAPLQWSDALGGYAQTWADYLAATGCTLQHRPSAGTYAQKYGENLFWGIGGDPSASSITGLWAAEAEHYNAATGACSGVCGHYTQMVWADTRYLGCGFSICSGTQTQYIFVCNYDPRGNVYGEKPY